MARNRIGYGVLLLGLAVFYVMLTDYLSWFVIVFFLLLPVLSLVLTALLCRDGALELKAGESVTCRGSDIHLVLVFRNRSIFLPVRTRVELSVTNEFTRGKEGETLILTAGILDSRMEQLLSSGHCGRLRIAVEKTGVLDFLGLFCLSHKGDLRQRVDVLVMPDQFLTGEICREGQGIRDVENDGLLQVVPGDDPSELYDLRDYRPGDRVTRIHWKLTDKFDRLMVKDFGRVVSNDMLLLVDFNGDRDAQGGVMDAFRSLSASLIAAEITHDVAWYCGHRGYGMADKVGTTADLNRVLSHMLSEGRPQESPLALQLRNRSERRTWYTRIACLCGWRGLTTEDLGILDEKSGEGRLLILCCRDAREGDEAGGEPDEAWDRFRADHPSAELVFFFPEEVEAVLRDLVL